MTMRDTKPRARRARALWMCLLVAACGGGDSGGVDRTAPTVSITAPAALASNLNGVIDFSATASSDASGVELQVDGVTVASIVGATASAQVDTTAHASGQHVLRARALDRVGNASPWARVTVQFGGTRTQPAGITRDEAFVTGLSSATAVAQLPDGRLLVAEQGGALRVVKGTQVLTMLTLPVDATDERGLLGVAVHPNFANTAWVYLYYTTTDSPPHNRVSRFTLSGDLIRPATEVPVLDLPALGATNHNGGALHFGPDGKLYVAVGENAVGANAQDLNTPLGKMLRINPDGSIPPDNPFCTANEQRCAVWARGLRNPFTFAIEPTSGRMLISDVGAQTWEEIDEGAAGANYGWPASEGPDNLGPGITGPLFAYPQALNPAGPGGFFSGFAVIGGAFYPSSGNFPAAWRGGYFFADFGSRFVAFLDLANDNAVYSFGSVSDAPVGLLVAADGALLVLTRSGVVRFAAA